MKLIVGLGNPGLIYSGTRHNIGFEIIKSLAGDQKATLKKEKGIKVLSGKGKIGQVYVLLTLPLTFMNLSGEVIKPILKRYRIALIDLLVVCDDLDLEFGRIKICSRGSSAGHRGIKSIADSLGSTEFSRLRVGIGRPGEDASVSDFVLSRFNRREKKDIPAIIDRSTQCARSWVEEGMDKTMNIFNRKGVVL
ncbi:MAG: aminoacyl-tRNA hydrolase [Candidatus Omnitrophota bacterium]